jgi:hypothetical protein
VSSPEWVGRKAAARVPGVPPRTALAPSAGSRHLATFVGTRLPVEYTHHQAGAGGPDGGGGRRGSGWVGWWIGGPQRALLSIM